MGPTALHPPTPVHRRCTGSSDIGRNGELVFAAEVAERQTLANKNTARTLTTRGPRHPASNNLYHSPYPIFLGEMDLSHTTTEKTKLLNRVRRVRGQIEALERAIEDEKGCAAVLHLVVGARGAINGLMAEVIEDHIRLHVVDPAKDAERRRGAEELIEAVQSYLK
jgi:FrmR/RcnR family transcriptional regulator, repressor of rcnA expression